MRPLVFLAIALGAVILLSKESVASPSASVATEEKAATALRQRQATEESGQTFVFEVAGLTDGTTGEVIIQTHPEWAPLGVKVRHRKSWILQYHQSHIPST